MRKIVIIAAIAMLVAACSDPAAMKVKVAPLGEPVSETTELGSLCFTPDSSKGGDDIPGNEDVPGPFQGVC